MSAQKKQKNNFIIVIRPGRIPGNTENTWLIQKHACDTWFVDDVANS